MELSEQTHTHECDLCGLLKTENNEACPQHRMWVAEAEVNRLRADLAEAREFAETLMVDWVPEHGWAHYKKHWTWLEDE